MNNKPDENTTLYPLYIKNKVDTILEKYNDEDEYLQEFQFITKEYLIQPHVRGILVYIGTGRGKSILAASISDYYRKYNSGRKIIILLSKSLQANFEINIKKYMKNNKSNSNEEKSDEFINDVLLNQYNFISMNSSNMFKQFSNLKKSADEIALEKQTGEQILSPGFLENSLLIIDEFHNLSNGITNQSKNAIKLYNAIMKTKNIKLVFLTATPIINNPFELVPTFNLLKGYITEQGKKHTLFPENPRDFENFFIQKKIENGVKTLDIKNKTKFQNRIFGMVSYYGDYYLDKDAKKNYPEEKQTIIEEIPMSLYQFGRYQEARDLERKEESARFKKSSGLDGFIINDENNKSSSSYRIRSRQISNYFIPEYALTFKNSRTSVTKHLSKIKDDDLKNLDKYSPKFKRIIENINKYNNKLGYVYSEFVSGEGLQLFGTILEKTEGYVYWEKSEKMMARVDIDEYDIKKPAKTKPQKTYAFITGEIPFLMRQNIINVFNSKENITGGLISLLLISKSGAEGLSLKCVRHIHIMEPFWNYARIEQVKARGIRFQSHLSLPEKERDVQPYIYISTYPKNYNKDLIKEKTTDEELLISSLNGKKLRDAFEIAMIEASIDCSINYNKIENDMKKNIACRLCAPTGEHLYDVNLYKDIAADDNCKPLSDKKIEAKEIKMKIGDEENTFYYTENNGEIKIYAYDEGIKGYIPLKKSYPFYADIARKILKFD